MDTNKITSIIAELEYGNLATQVISSHSVDGYCLTDERFLVVWSNSSFNQNFGYPEDEINRQQIDIFLKDNPLKKKENLDLIQKNTKLTDLNGQAIHKSGRRFFSSINITMLNYENSVYYLYSFPLYSKRVKKIIEMMKHSFSYFVKEKDFFLVEIDINHPYNIRVITRECYSLLNKDFSEMQSKSILLFLTNESRILISDVLEDLAAGDYDHYIVSLEWKKHSTKIIKTRTIVQTNKPEESFLLLVVPISLESEGGAEDIEGSNSGLSSASSGSYQPIVDFKEKMFDFLENSINELELQTREMEKQIAKIETEIQWILKSWENSPEDKSILSLTFEEKIFTCLERYKTFLIPGMAIALIVMVGIASVHYPHNPYIKKIESIMLNLIDKNNK